MTTLKISPLVRANGPGTVEVDVRGERVAEARVVGDFYRGLERIFEGRDPHDLPYLTSRVCGICSTAHALAASEAVENMVGAEIPPNGLLLRNLMFGADILQNHIRHFYLLELPDFIQMPSGPPYFGQSPAGAERLGEALTKELLGHYREATQYSQRAHELVVILGGKIPHTHGILPGGATASPDGQQIARMRSLISDLTRFVRKVYRRDADRIAALFPETLEYGRGPGNLLAYPMFRLPEGRYVYEGGALIDGNRESVDTRRILEHVRFSHFRDMGPAKPLSAAFEGDLDKNGAYSWVRAPRYNGRPCEGGPHTRLKLAGLYHGGPSTGDRLVGRSVDAERICDLMKEWVEGYRPGQPAYREVQLPREGEGVGFTDAMRGPLGHWLRVEAKRVSRYVIITPTAWNLSPRDDLGQRGPAEEALVGLRVRGGTDLTDVARTIRSFDACFACAVRVIENGHRRQSIVIS